MGGSGAGGGDPPAGWRGVAQRAVGCGAFPHRRGCSGSRRRGSRVPPARNPGVQREPPLRRYIAAHGRSEPLSGVLHVAGAGATGATPAIGDAAMCVVASIVRAGAAGGAGPDIDIPPRPPRDGPKQCKGAPRNACLLPCSLAPFEVRRGAGCSLDCSLARPPPTKQPPSALRRGSARPRRRRQDSPARVAAWAHLPRYTQPSDGVS